MRRLKENMASKSKVKKIKPNGKLDTGRPTIYDPSYCKLLEEYFDVEPYKTVTVKRADKNGNTYEVTEEVANDFPHIVQFCKLQGLSRSVVYNWIDPSSDVFHKEFLDTYKKCINGLRERYLMVNGLKGTTQQAMSIFLLKALAGLSESQRVEVTGKDGGPIERLEITKEMDDETAMKIYLQAMKIKSAAE